MPDVSVKDFIGDFMKVHERLREVRREIQVRESDLAILRAKERDLELDSNFEFKRMADRVAFSSRPMDTPETKG